MICDLKPSGKFVITDLYNAGGIPAVMSELLRAGLLHGDCMTITGQTTIIKKSAKVLKEKE